MALNEESGMGTTMLVQPTGGYGGGMGGGLFGGDFLSLIVLFFLFMMIGGWNGTGNCGNGGMGNMYPWMNQSNQISDGFQTQMLNDNLNGIKDAITSAQYADLERSFAAQTANTAGLTALQGQLAQCCCDNRLATCQTQNIVASESAATRSTIQSSVQGIMDKLCALELDGYKRENDNLRSQLNMAELKASQTAQNAFIAQGLNAEVDALYNRLSNCPVPSTPVYGRTPIFSCGGNTGCGCGG